MAPLWMFLGLLVIVAFVAILAWRFGQLPLGANAPSVPQTATGPPVPLAH